MCAGVSAAGLLEEEAEAEEAEEIKEEEDDDEEGYLPVEGEEENE